MTERIYSQQFIIDFANSVPAIVIATSKEPINAERIEAYYVKQEKFDPDRDRVILCDKPLTLNLDTLSYSP